MRNILTHSIGDCHFTEEDVINLFCWTWNNIPVKQNIILTLFPTTTISIS